MSSAHNRPIIIVEDNIPDFTMLSHALKASHIEGDLVHLQTGDEVETFFWGDDPKGLSSLEMPPALIFLDLQLPNTDGWSLLAQIKQTEALCAVPIIILSSMANDRDIQLCYQRGANSYLIKELDIHVFKEKVQTVVQYWFHTVELPFKNA